MTSTTTIELKKTTHATLVKMGGMDESFDDVVNRLIKGMEERKKIIVVAASDSSVHDKQRADLICTGRNDHLTVNAAMDALRCGGTVALSAGEYDYTMPNDPPIGERAENALSEGIKHPESCFTKKAMQW